MIAAAPVPPQPNVTITLVQGLPEVMQVGETYTVEVLVTSDIPFNTSAAMPDVYYPGRYVAGTRGDHGQSGTTSTLYVTFTAKDSTSGLPNGVAPVAVVAGARFGNGYSSGQRFDFLVTVP